LVRAVLAVLTLDGVLSAIAGAFLLPLYAGAVPLPVSGVISGLVNAALVWAAMEWTSSARLALLPLWAWLVTTALLTLGGPGDDIVFGTGTVTDLLRLLFFVAVGAVPAVMVHRRRRTPNA
jgi:hypothetical protein